MELLNKIEPTIDEWLKENKENRSVLVIAVEREVVKNEECILSTFGLMNGNPSVMSSAVYQIMSEKKPKKATLKKVFLQAVRRYALDGMIEQAAKSCERIGRIMDKLGMMTDRKEEEASISATNDAQTAGKEEGNE